MNKLILLIIIQITQLFSQAITGIVYDKKTGAILSDCNITLLGTSRGTISNSDGFYRIIISAGNYRLLFQHVGYKSDTLRISLNEKNIQKDIYLKGQVYYHDDIIVYANPYSEADQLILRASVEKEKTLKFIQNYSCKSYTKLTISANTDSFKIRYGLLNEIYSELTWNKPDYWHEIIRSQKVSANIPESISILSGNTFLDINSDRINLGNRIIVGPISPDAIGYYNYEILDTLYQDNNRIFKLSITPKNNTRPLMSGVIFLIDELFIIQKIDIILNAQSNYEMFEDIHIVQFYKAINDSIFLPYNSLRESALNIDFPGAPKLKYKKINFREDYKINNQENDKYSRQTKVIFSNEIPFDSISMHIPPLSLDEINSYARIDSMVVNNITFNLFTKVLKLIDTYAYFQSLPIGKFSDFYRFNRVEGNFAGAAINTKNLNQYFRLYAGFGYGFSDKQTKYFIYPEIKTASKKSIYGIKLGFYKRLLTRENVSEFPLWMNTFYSLIKFDYFDYYYSIGSSISSYYINAPFSICGTVFSERHTRANRSIHNIPLSGKPFIENLQIEKGEVIGLKCDLKYSSASLRELPLLKERFEYRNYFEVVFNYETGFKEWGSHFAFRRYHFLSFLRQNTFYKGFLDLTLVAGFGSGNLPLQKQFELESGDFTGYDRFKTFRTLPLNSFVGSRKIAVYLEHNFQNTLFHLLGVHIIRDISYDFSIIYNIGWAGEKSFGALKPNLLYSEAGFGIGRIFNFFKLEVLWALKKIPDSKNFTWTIKTVDFEL